MFDAVFGKKQTQNEPVSILAEWNKYSGNKPQDAATPSTSTNTPTRTPVPTGQKITGFFSQSFKQVSSTVSNASNSIQQSTTSVIPTGQQLTYFAVFIGFGVLFLTLAFTVALPILVLSPSKFAISFSLGCLCVMLAFCALRGWKNSYEHMFSRSRLPFTAGYITSVFGTLYAAMALHSYILSLICSGIQVIALIYYVVSYFPGGAQGAQFMLKMLYQALVNCLIGVKNIIVGGT